MTDVVDILVVVGAGGKALVLVEDERELAGEAVWGGGAGQALLWAWGTGGSIGIGC